MRTARLLLALPGVAAIVWGVLLLLDRPDGLVSVLVWAGGAVLVHDLVVAPLTVVVGLGLGRLLPPATRAPTLLLLAGWALVTVAVSAVLSGQGGKPDNPTLLTGDYPLAWGVATILVALAVGTLVVVGVRQERRRTSAPS